MSNQPLAFGALIGGGLLITAALTGDSLGQVITGQAKSLSTPSGQHRIDGSLAAAVNSTDGLVNPFAGARDVRPGRVDMGQDYNMAPGSPIGALGNSVVKGIIPGWYSGQPFVWFQLLNENGQPHPTASHPYAGRYWYVAEQINPTVRVGQVVRAGETVATFAAQGTGIEAGWAAGDGHTLAQARGDVNPSSHYSSEGQDFADTIKHLMGVAG